jgi:hypothetical protein
MPADLEVRERLVNYGWALWEFSGRQDEYLRLASQFGRPRASRLNGPLVDRLAPLHRHAARKKSMSAVFGTGAFPYHTDAAYFRVPPRYVFLRMVGNVGCERPTLLKDFGDVIGSNALRHDVWLVNSGRDRFYAPIVDDALIDGCVVFRFDPCCMRPVTNGLSASENIIQDLVREKSAVTIKWVPGLVLAIDNWRVAHARGNAPETDDSERLLERVLVDEQFDI